MRPESLTIATRPRNAWQAADLGVRLTQAWARWLWPPLAVAVALILAASGVFVAALGVPAAWLIVSVWWAKPLYDRVLLSVASHAVFGQHLGIRETWRQRKSWSPELFWQLTLGRFQWHRAFYLPVLQLEGLEHRSAEWRRRQLRNKGYAIILLGMGLCAELIVVGSLANLVNLAAQLPELYPREGSKPVWETSQLSVALVFIAAYVVAVLLVEPFYVLACFALYLNSRIVTEGWDLELAFRSLTRRRQAAGGTSSTGAGIITVLALSLAMAGGLPTPARAQTPDSSTPEEVMAKVLDEEAFDTTRTEERLRHRSESETPDQAKDQGPESATRTEGDASPSTETAASPPEVAPGGGAGLAPTVGGTVRFLLIAVLIGAAAVAIYVIYRNRPDSGAESQRRQRSARAGGGTNSAILRGNKRQPLEQKLDTAQRYAHQGKPREALAALFQTALLVVSRGGSDYASESTWTEAELLQAARENENEAIRDLIPRIIDMWQLAAYAHQPPDQGQLTGLVERCRDQLQRGST